ncbi:hypothetical protein KSP40_PGU003470 [Platanthera guangdongensis]|uniref:Uncharacterized protein n=1 Tax=Platanthera guangdongensis TaxID=2320717 RepID=A0ABR2MM54_9ASPA
MKNKKDLLPKINEAGGNREKKNNIEIRIAGKQHLQQRDEEAGGRMKKMKRPCAEVVPAQRRAPEILKSSTREEEIQLLKNPAAEEIGAEGARWKAQRCGSVPAVLSDPTTEEIGADGVPCKAQRRGSVPAVLPAAASFTVGYAAPSNACFLAGEECPCAAPNNACFPAGEECHCAAPSRC